MAIVQIWHEEGGPGGTPSCAVSARPHRFSQNHPCSCATIGETQRWASHRLGASADDHAGGGAASATSISWWSTRARSRPRSSRALRNGRNWADMRAGVEGRSWPAGGQHGTPFIQNLDDFTPRWDLLADVEAYLLQFLTAPSRSHQPWLPSAAAFCYNEIVMKRTWRQHGDQFILDQINWLKEHHGISAVDYADDYHRTHQADAAAGELVSMRLGGRVRVRFCSSRSSSGGWC